MVRWPNQPNLTATTDIGYHGKLKEQPPVETYVSSIAFTVRGHHKNRSLSNLSVRQEAAIQRHLTKSEGSLPSTQLERLRMIIEDDDRRLLQWIAEQKNLCAILEPDHKGNTLVHLAIKTGSMRCLQLMIKTPQGLEALSIKNFEGFYPLGLLPNKKNSPRFRAGLDNVDFQNRLVTCYPYYVTTTEEKYYHEAEFAKSTLENPENIALVNLITRTISQLLLKMKDNIFSEYLKEVNLDLLRRNFPTSSLIDYSSKASLSETLKVLTEGNENHIVDIMSVLWRLAVFLLENEGSSVPDRLEHIYESFNIIGRSHFIDLKWTQAVTNDNESKFDFRPTDSLSG